MSPGMFKKEASGYRLGLQPVEVAGVAQSAARKPDPSSFVRPAGCLLDVMLKTYTASRASRARKRCCFLKLRRVHLHDALRHRRRWRLPLGQPRARVAHQRRLSSLQGGECATTASSRSASRRRRAVSSSRAQSPSSGRNARRYGVASATKAARMIVWREGIRLQAVGLAINTPRLPQPVGGLAALGERVPAQGDLLCGDAFRTDERVHRDLMDAERLELRGKLPLNPVAGRIVIDHRKQLGAGRSASPRLLQGMHEVLRGQARRIAAQASAVASDAWAMSRTRAKRPSFSAKRMHVPLVCPTARVCAPSSRKPRSR